MHIKVAKDILNGKTPEKQKSDAAQWREDNQDKFVNSSKIVKLPEYKYFVTTVFYELEDRINLNNLGDWTYGVAVETRFIVAEGSLQATDWAIVYLMRKYPNELQSVKVVETQAYEINQELLEALQVVKSGMEQKYKDQYLGTSKPS